MFSYKVQIHYSPSIELKKKKLHFHCISHDLNNPLVITILVTLGTNKDLSLIEL
jgi:hypothetical protein